MKGLAGVPKSRLRRFTNSRPFKHTYAFPHFGKGRMLCFGFVCGGVVGYRMSAAEVLRARGPGLKIETWGSGFVLLRLGTD
jgi:hypothetical protein